MKSIEYLVTGEEMQKYDNNTIQHFNVPGLLLMEQAALASTEEIVHLFPSEKENILILAGMGNNGGDAMAVARLLSQKGYRVTVFVISNRPVKVSNFSESAKVQYEILKKMNIPIVTNLPSDSYDIIIDGIFGVGLNRNITGNTENIINQINAFHGYKIALDIPSGLHAGTGAVCGTAFRADTTITFAFLKRGLYLLEGIKYSGKIVKKEIGITKNSFLEQPPDMFTLTGDIKEYLPARNPLGHKGTFGKILLIAGSKEIGGAAILAGKAAMMSGCGMLRICTHREHKNAILTLLPEAMVDSYATLEEAIYQVKKGLDWADVIAIGPGIGTGECADVLLKIVIKTSSKPLVIDADALNLLADVNNFQILKESQNLEQKRRTLILTPHPMELSRISGAEKKELLQNGLEIAKNIAKELHAVVIKKDAKTVVCSENFPYIINLRGNSGMATAGSGDVLTGILAAMLAFKLPTHEAAALGVHIHATAGDLAAKQKNAYSMLAGDICNALCEILH